MKLKKILAAFLSAAMVVTSAAIPVLAEGKTLTVDAAAEVTDDTVATLADAIEKIKAAEDQTGWTIELKAATTEYEPVEIPAGVNDLTITGISGADDAKPIIKFGYNGSPTYTGYTYPCQNSGGMVIDGSGITFENIKFVGGDYIPTEGQSWYRSAIGYSNESVAERGRLVVHDCDFVGDKNAVRAIYGGSWDVEITGCTFDNFAAGFYTENVPGGTEGGITITGNTFTNVDAPVSMTVYNWHTATGDFPTEGVDIVIKDNKIGEARTSDVTPTISVWDYGVGTDADKTISSVDIENNTTDAGVEVKTELTDISKDTDVIAPDDAVNTYSTADRALDNLDDGDTFYMNGEDGQPQTYTKKDDTTYTDKEGTEQKLPMLRVGTKTYSTFKDFGDNGVAKLNDGDTILMLKDSTKGQDAKAITIENKKNITIDLGGHSYFSSSVNPAFTFINSTVTIKNGTIKSSDAQTGITIINAGTGSTVKTENLNLTVGKDYESQGIKVNAGAEVNVINTKISGGTYGILLIDDYGVPMDSAKLTIDGSETDITGSNAAIAGNGSNDNTEIVINDGYIHTEGLGIYHPQNGSLTINGGTIEGGTGIAFAGDGNLTISGGTLIGTSEDTEVPDPDKLGGAYTDGAAVTILSRTSEDGYGTPGGLTLNIKGGEFESYYTSAVQEYSDSASESPIIATDKSSISGGSFTGGSKTPDAKISAVKFEFKNVTDKGIISGGTYSSDVKDYIKAGLGETQVGNKYVITDEGNIAASAALSLEATADNPHKYAIRVKASDPEKIINRYMASELTFSMMQGGASSDAYVVTPCDNAIIDNDYGYDSTENSHKYALSMNGSGSPALFDSGDGVIIGYVEVIGFGPYELSVNDAVIRTATAKDNIVDTYFTNAEAGGAEPNLSITPADGASGNVAAKGDKEQAEKTLTVQVAFPNEVEYKETNYTNMTVDIKGLILKSDITAALGKNGKVTEAGTSIASVKHENISIDGKSYTGYTFSVDLPEKDRYTLTFSGDGYRTFSRDVLMDGNKTITVWNNVMDGDTPVVTVDGEIDGKAERFTFLAGDIDNSQKIDLYDLSADVAYFGKTDVEGDFVRYDLNRDGAIDSKDIAMVLVSWGY